MKPLFALAAVGTLCAFLVPTAGMAAPPAKKKSPGKCVVAGGSANMITRDLAEFMAKAALGNSIKGMGAKPVGEIKLSCKDGLPVYCIAKQKACK